MSAQMLKYTHPPLVGPRSIRVLHLEPAPLPTSPLRCSLAEVSVDAPPEYLALSYSWDAQLPSCPVECGGGRLYITPNCVAALRQLRHSHEAKTLWIDSICIDQTSLDERSRQVALMGEIYKRAKQVIVWLGEGDSSTEEAIRRLSNIGKLGAEQDAALRESSLRLMFGLEAKDALGDPIGPLFKRSWFHRMWTIQEATLASVENVVVYCGDKTLPWIHLVLAVDYLKVSKYKWGQWDEAMQLQKHISMLLMSRRYPGLDETVGSLPGSVSSYQGILQILTFAREKGSTEPKDKIFALFGVLGELGIKLPLPDYKKTLEQVYTEAVVACINNDRNLHILFEVPSDHRHSGLPSWVPDWSDAGWKSSDPRKAVGRDRFGASRSADPEWSFLPDQRHLVLSGKVVDSISYRAGSLEVDIEVSSGFQLIAGGQLRMADFLHSLHSAFNILRSWVDVSLQHDKYSTGETVQVALQCTLVNDEKPPNPISRTEAFDSWYRVMTAPHMDSMATAARGLQSTPLTSPVLSGASSKGRMEQTPQEMRSFLALTTGPASEFHFAVLKHSHQKCFFSTDNGYFGTAPDQIQPNDKIAILAGLEMPVVLRAVDQGYQFVTHAYVHGLMYGEAWPEDATDIMEITLV